MQDRLSRGARQLPPLKPGDQVQVQAQHGNSPRVWSKTGVIVDVGEFDSYVVSLDGSRQLTKRNRKFLRKIIPLPDTYKHSESTDVKPVTIRPTPPPPTPPRTPRSVSAQPPAPTSPSRQAPAPPQTSTSPSTPYQSQVVPPIMIRREGDGYQVVPGPVQQVSPLLTPQSVPCLPWPLPSVPPSPFWPPLTPQSPLTAPWSWPTSYQPQATRL